MSVSVMVQASDIRKVDYVAQGPMAEKAYVIVWNKTVGQSVTLFIDCDALELIVTQGKADQARQDAAVQP
jgi:hypothetical protein